MTDAGRAAVRLFGRFGFRADPSLVLPDVPPAYFQVIAFYGTVAAGAVSYSEAVSAAR